MNPTHIHLALCHFPVVGEFFAVAGLLVASFKKDPALHRWMLGVTVLVGLSVLPVTWSGERSEDAVQSLPGISMDLISEHEEAAEASMSLALAASGVAALGIVASFMNPGAMRVLTVLALISSLAAAGFLGRAANLGGQIRHTEIREDATSSARGPGGT